MSNFNNDFSKEIFENTYEHKNEGIEGMWKRLSESTGVPYETFTNFKFVPAGRICSNAGAGYEGATMINCFVSGFIPPKADSMESIMAELRRQALILKSEGGYGANFSVLRPRGAYIKGVGATTPGAVEMMDMWDTQSRVITKGSGEEHKEGKKKIRKGAMMGVLNIWHPDIEEFITAKQTPGRLTKFNISVGVIDLFMEAVEKDDKWELVFPDIEQNKSKYDAEWDGDIGKWIEKGGSIKVYKTLRARDLYKLITDSTYNRNEPGVLFLDTMNRMNNLVEIEHINATNPCGEQPLPDGGACLLGALNLTQYVKKDYTGFSVPDLRYSINDAVRSLDNVIEITNLPLPKQRVEIDNKRRIGLGIMGLGSSLMMLQIRYGSKRSLEIIDTLFKFIANTAYKASAHLAEEKGAYPLWDFDNFMKGGFAKHLEEDTIELIKKHGLRNSHILTIAPTGNTGIMANVVSGGFEPVFMPEYIRTSGVDTIPEGLVPSSVDLITYIHENWTETKEGDVSVWITEYNNIKYKFDNDRGLTKESWVRDYGVQNLIDRGLWDPKADWAATTTELEVSNHTDVMEVVAGYVDSAISKTINVPNDYPYESFQDLYLNAWKTGTIKGITTYRDGTMTAVLKSADTKDVLAETYKRPKKVKADVHIIKYNKERYSVLVGLNERTPSELFVIHANRGIFIGDDVNEGTLVKAGSDYRLETDDIIVKKLVSHLTDEEQIITRLISVGFLHRGDIDGAIKQLDKSPGSVASFAQVLKRVLVKYQSEAIDGPECPECGKTMTIEEGCKKCYSCGHAMCS